MFTELTDDLLDLRAVARGDRPLPYAANDGCDKCCGSLCCSVILCCYVCW